MDVCTVAQVQVGKGLQRSVSCGVCTSNPELCCPALIPHPALILSLSPEQRPAEFKDPANPFLSAQQSSLNHLCALSSGVTDHS